MHDDLTALTATAAIDALRNGTVTSERLVSACLDRIASREASVGAWAHLDPDYALTQARAADEARRQGKSTGSLHGIPVGIKDIIDTARLPTENGSAVFKGRRPAADAAVVTQLKAAGAIILGKTVTTELAFFSPGKTRNPINLDHTPGGSSSGSAAAVADRHVPLALGTQTAGSLIRPASFCGVIGFKPTFGRISRTGVLPQSAPLDTIGGYARSVEDVALLVDCMSGFDPRDTDMRDLARTPLVSALGREAERLPLLAFVTSPAWSTGEDSMKAAFADFVGRLGAGVQPVELPARFDGSLRLQQIIQFADIAKNYGPFFDAYPDKISAKLAEVIAEGRMITPAQYDAAIAEREPLYEEIVEVLSTYDAIVTPASAGPAPKGSGATGSPAFNALWTYLGAPAISLPLLEVNGLPLGVQLVGARNEDGKLLNTAQWLVEYVTRAARLTSA